MGPIAAGLVVFCLFIIAGLIVFKVAIREADQNFDGGNVVSEIDKTKEPILDPVPEVNLANIVVNDKIATQR